MDGVIVKNLRELELESAHGGTGARKLILSAPADSVSIEAFTRGYLEPACAFDWHNHEGVDELFVCERGRGLVQFENGEGVKYSPGSVFYVPADLKHRIEAWGEETSEFYFIRVRSSGRFPARR